jgi:hypothetical protein
MILVQGRESAFIRELLAHFSSLGLEARAVGPDDHLFTEATTSKAKCVVGVGLGLTEAEQAAQARALTAAATSPVAPKIVLLTPARGDAEPIRALKRDGAPYVVVLAEGCLAVRDETLRGKTMWISTDILGDPPRVRTQDQLLDEVARAVDEEGPIGCEVAPLGSPLDELVRRAGGKVLATPNWLARLRAGLGKPAVFRDSTGAVKASVSLPLPAPPADPSAASARVPGVGLRLHGRPSRPLAWLSRLFAREHTSPQA